MHLCRILNISCHEKIFVRIRTKIFKWDSIQRPLNKSRPRPAVRAEREYFVILIQRLCKVTSRMNLWIVAITGRQNQNFEYVFKWVQMRYSSSEHVSCASSVPASLFPASVTLWTWLKTVGGLFSNTICSISPKPKVNSKSFLSLIVVQLGGKVTLGVERLIH